MSLLWTRAVRIPETRHVPVAKLLKDYRPTESTDWNALRREYHRDHPVMMRSLREDFGERGVLTPVDAFPHWEGGWGVHNGHHRILAAEDAGLATVPVRHWQDEADIPRVKRYWDPESREHYGPEDDEDDEGQLRY